MNRSAPPDTVSQVPVDEGSGAASMPLSRLARGRSARILSVGGSGPFRRRLLELGLIPGTTIHRAGTAPLGDPLSFRVRHAVVSLRRSDAAMISVEPAG